MSVTINGIACEELVEGFEEGVDGRGPYAVKGYLCDWNSRYAVANGLLGFSTAQGFNNPLKYPESANMYAQQVSIEPRGRPLQGSRQSAWTKAAIFANYGVSSWGPLSADDPNNQQGFSQADPFIYATQELDFNTQFVTVPNSAVEFKDGPPRTKLAQDLGIPVAVIDMQLTLHRMPYMPMGVCVTAAAAPLNSVTFLGAAKGKVMFNGAKTKRTATTDGGLVQEVTYSFSYRPTADWNYYIHPTSGAWTEVVKTGGSTNLLAYSDLNGLIPSFYRG